MNFLTVFRKEMMEQWRTYRFLIVAAVFAAFGLASPLLAKFTPEMLKAIPGVPAELLASIPAPTRGRCDRPVCQEHEPVRHSAGPADDHGRGGAGEGTRHSGVLPDPSCFT